MNRVKPRLRPKVAGLYIAAALAVAACSPAQESTLSATHEDFGAQAPELFTTADSADYASIVAAPDPRTIISIVEDDGQVATTEGATEPIPALSQAKLFLGAWVLFHVEGSEDQVLQMLRYSDDAIADELDATYPEAIPAVIERYGLGDTSYNGYWGNTVTTTNDLARFIHLVQDDATGQAILEALSQVSPIAADGYPQDFGTAQLPGVLGTKFGWSDDLSAHSTASIADGYVIVAYTYGTPEELTEDVLGSVAITQ
ncbi:class A beta-lactamase-related serine hydrolase [Corynebacterium sp. 35RC1]|nr:class A beta-lactamase-related serine hydrolase [Corynebacterium sp. 35RC1]